MRRIRHFFALTLTLAMLFSNMFTTYASTLPSAEKNVSASGTTAVRISDVDPETLNVPRMTDTEETDSAEAPAHKDTDIVRVSIILDGKSTLDAGYSIEGIGTNKKAISYRAALEKKQNKLAKTISSQVLGGKELDVKWNLTLAANLISAEVAYGDIEKIAGLPGVKEVVIENRYVPYEDDSSEADRPTMVNARDMTGTNGVNATKYKGAGSRLAIIDTGLDIEHQSFDEEAFLHAIEEDGTLDQLMTAEDVAAVWEQLNFSRKSPSSRPEGSYYSAKIPFIGNYVDNNQNVTHLNDTQEEHGSHVAGISTANRYVKAADGSFVDAGETYGVVGQAPDAQIFVMKVFGSGGGAYDSDYMVAIEDAIVMGASSVNLSLGSSAPGTSINTNGAYQTIFNNLANSGIVAAISAGNNTSWDSNKQLYADDINYHTGGSPGSFTNSFTVASIDDTGVYAPYLLFDGSIEVRYAELSGGTQKAPTTSVAGTYDYVYIDAVGNPEEYEAVADLVAGNIALVNRGSITFGEKATGAVGVGAVATIIVNNQAGTLSSSTVGDDYPYTNPVAGILQSDGAAIKAQSEEHDAGSFKYYTGTIKIGSAGDLTPMAYYSMSSFSSWGTPGSLVMKPEITTPGGSVLSLNGYHRAQTGGYAGGHDQYELMSGTSMAAPQVTGLVAAIAQYYREENIAERTGLSLRNFAQSMFMATAVPVIEQQSDHYYSLLNQGAGLANLEAAVTAKSFIQMSTDDGTITALMGSAADGKVKAEVGDDPARTGKFNYTFTITNFSEEAVKYNLRTDLFTQDLEADDTLLSHQTTPIEGTTTYDISLPFESHDVNKDGKTDRDDVQALLDYLSRKSKVEIDTNAAEVDGNKGLSSRDALVLLQIIKAQESAVGADSFTLQPGMTATITVKIAIPANGKLASRENGGYVEGFTFIESDDDVTYSIPVLGYYGSWTDPSMFDAVTYVEKLYGSEQSSYFGATNTNGIRFKKDASSTDQFVTGNPYAVEKNFPADKLAIRSEGVIFSAVYTLIRFGGTVFPAATNADGKLIWLGSVNRNQANAYYNTQATTPTWQQTNSRTLNMNLQVSSLGLREGEQFTAGLYALPEYYGILASDGTSSSLTNDQITAVVESGAIGKGGFLGFTFTIDDTKPVIEEVNFTDSTISVTVKDDRYVAYLALMDVSGRKVFGSVVPEQSEPGTSVTYTFDREGINANAVVVFTGDYAGNEKAAIYRIGEGDIIIEKDIYVLSDLLVAGKDYLIVNTNVVSSANALTHSGATKGVDAVTVFYDTERGIAIDGKEVDDTSVFTASANGSGVLLKNGEYYLTAGRSGWSYNVTFTTTAPSTSNYFTYNPDNHALGYRSGNNTYYVRYNNGQYTAANSVYPVYLYERFSYTEVFDENKVDEVIVTPTSARIFVGEEPIQFSAEVLPITLDDKTVTWSSSNEEVATVDANGFVTAVGAGTVTIKATANKDNTTSASATVIVEELTRMDASINAQLSDDDGDKFVSIDLNTGKTTTLGTAAAQHYGGGRSGNAILGMTSSGDIVYTVITPNGYISDSPGGYGTTSYNSRDGAQLPYLKATVDGETVTEEYLGLHVSASYVLTFTPDFSLSGWNTPNLTAIAYIGTDLESNLHYYYTLNGTMLGSAILGVDADEPVTTDGINATLSTGTVGSIANLTVSANNMSMTILSTDKYYGLLIVNNESKEMSFVDLTADTLNAVKVAAFTGADRISTLYNDNVDADVVVQNIDSRDRFIARTDKSGGSVYKMEKLDVLQAQEKEADGGLNAIRSTTFVKAPTDKKTVPIELTRSNLLGTSGDSTTGDDGSAIVEISEDEIFNNGLYEVSYDPDELTFVEATCSELADFYSVNNDEGNGVVTVTAISLDGIPAGTAIATITFEVGCNNADVTITTKEVNEELELNDSIVVTVQGTGHNWGAPVWSWADDNSSASATFTCENDSTHTETVEATMSEEVTKEPTTEETGTKTITATVVGPDGETYTDSREVEIPKLDPVIPDTGDHSHLGLYAATMLLSALGMALVVIKRRRQMN